LMTLETVITDTPALRATSAWDNMAVLFYPALSPHFQAALRPLHDGGKLQSRYEYLKVY
jgi:hypothetical protein